jgi:hypothetical protein
MMDKYIEASNYDCFIFEPVPIKEKSRGLYAIELGHLRFLEFKKRMYFTIM